MCMCGWEGSGGMGPSVFGVVGWMDSREATSILSVYILIKQFCPFIQ